MSAGGQDDTVAELAGDPVEVREDEPIAGRYRIVRWLGAGGMGRVYEALDTELGERVALKMLRGGLTDEAIQRFRREVKLTRRIQHRNVARMFDIGEHRADKFLTMELIDGTPLTRELGGEMAWPRLARLAVQLCAGLAAAHDAGVVHRDLKPDNVMIERGTERAVIMDFGIARGGDEIAVTQLGALIGTPRYMAPEQLAGEAADHRADLFALGVMLYELATGKRPWSGDTPIAIAVAQATQPARPITAPRVPAAFAAAIERCLQIDPALRPASAAALGAAIAAGGPVPEPAPRPAVAVPRPDPDPAGEAIGRATIPGIGGPGLAAPLPTLPALQTTVAVLPVACAAGDEDLADGLLDDLVDTLSSTATLRVRPAGVVRSRGEADPQALGRALGVDHVVAASLRRTPAGLRIAARLIGVADGFQIWAHREDCGETDILAAADRLGRGVATALSARAISAERPTDPRAVDLYLRARAELRRYWGNHAQNAADLLEQAAALTPSSPPILGALAFATVQAWIMRGAPELRDRARRAVERGLAGGHGEAFLAAGTLRLNHGDHEGAAVALGTALVRAPMSAQAHETAGRILIELDAAAEGRYHLETAIALDPGRTSVISADLGRLDALQGNWDGALARCQQLRADPDPSVAQLGAVLDARLAAWRRDRQASLTAARRFASRVEPAGRLITFFEQASRTGAFDLAQWGALEQGLTSPERPVRSQLMSLQLMTELSLMLDQHDLALRALGKAADTGLIDVTWLRACPLFAPITGDLRLQVIRDAVERRAAAMLAAFRVAAG